MAVVAQYTAPLNSMVEPRQRAFVDREQDVPGRSRADVVREALDLQILLSEAGVSFGDRVPTLRRVLDSGSHQA